MKKTFLSLFCVITVMMFCALIPSSSLKVEAAGGQQSASAVSVTLTTYFDASNIITVTLSGRTYGETLALDGDLASQPSGGITYDFLFWEQNGVLRQWPIDHEFVLTGENTLKAVFSPSNRHVVTYVDSNGKILKLDYVTDGSTSTPPVTLPTKLGYTSSGWNGSTTNVTSDRILTLQYSANEAGTHLITVENGTGGGTIAFNTKTTITATVPEGKMFHHWTVNGIVVGYENPLTITVLSAQTFVPVFADAPASLLPRVFLGENLGLRASEFRKTYVGRFVIPAGYQLVEYGLLTHTDGLAILDLDTAGVVRKPLSKYTPDTFEWLVSIATLSAQTVRAYLIVRTPEATLSTVYSESIYQVTNGGFETGNLFGWTPYQLWKEESNLSAFRNERIVSTANYGSGANNFYDRDGNYLLGVYKASFDNTDKDLNQERMGMLKSADFVLSGSGWISFKLGGGKNQGAAYLSVHDAATGNEIARYGNRHFSATVNSIAQTQVGSSATITNSEAFLFQYYADLSAYLGRTLYFLLVDQASHEWNVLSADSFQTYWPIAPTPLTDQTATNILPVISGAGAATNTIPGGALSNETEVNSWDDPQGVFRYANGGAISSEKGDSGLGVLRSPAFSLIGTNKYLKFEFAGAVQRDKQVFVLVKEVGTNLEVMRLVRRADLASTADSGDFKAHWFDLSSLSTSKEYYLEIVDNRDGGWGVALIRNVVLSNTADLDYRVAVNADYGLAQVDANSGMHRNTTETIESGSSADAFLVTLTPGADAADAVHIRYQSQSSLSQIEYTRSTDSAFLNSTKINLTGTAFSTDLSNVGGIAFGFASRYLYTADLSGLDPDTEYLFRITDGYGIEEGGSFTTAPATGSFRFLYFTDTQADTFAETMVTRSMWQTAYARYSDYRFSVITGDIVEVGKSPQYWDWFLETGVEALPILAVPGNHDYQNQDRATTSAQGFNAMIRNPQNGPAGRLNSSYYVTYGNVLFVMLDVVTRDSLAEHQAWFADTVEANRRDFVIVGMHYSPYGTYHDPDAAQMLTDWSDSFDAAGVDLVLSGHDHMYARTPRMVDGAESSNQAVGTYYLMGGTGGHKLGTGYECVPMYDACETTSSTTFSIFNVSSTTLSIETINLAGAVVDTFSIAKDTPPELAVYPEPDFVNPHYAEMRAIIDPLIAAITDPVERLTFQKTFYATLDGVSNNQGTWPSVLTYRGDGTTYVSTGDIDAMWLRDSAVQVLPYLQFMNDDVEIQLLVKSIIKMQFQLIQVDPYANAFHSDKTVHEQKFEIDSLIYPLWLATQYYDITNDASIFDSVFETTLHLVMDTLIQEQTHDELNYHVENETDRGIDVEAVNTASKLIWSGYRPSDDVTYYKFFIPGNMFAAATLEKIALILDTLGLYATEQARAETLAAEVRLAIETYGVYMHPIYGKIYVYETQGLTSDAASSEGKLLMDAANVPSLLSIPWLGYVISSDSVYQNTRDFILSTDNPYYYVGSLASGIGDPHDMIGSTSNPHPLVPVPWHMSLAMQALTTSDAAEIELMVDYMTQTTGGTYVMHEAFNANDPTSYSRNFFTWPCSLYAHVYLTLILHYHAT